MRISVCILPDRPFREAAASWRHAEELGFHAAYTYDHITWAGLPDSAWYGAMPTLAAAAGVTSRIRIGTLVTSPNYRHPVPLAHDVVTLDAISEGRFVLGFGSQARRTPTPSCSARASTARAGRCTNAAAGSASPWNSWTGC